MQIWNFQTQLTRRLTLWAVLSIFAGILLLFSNEFATGMGIQFIAWGLIDLMIAVFGAQSARRRKARLSLNELPAAALKETANLKQILLVNTGLDILYMAGGLALIWTLGSDSASWRGHGWGILIQGAFLFFFDLFHALKLRS